VNVTEAPTVLGVKPATVWHHLKTGSLPATVDIDATAVEALKAKRFS